MKKKIIVAVKSLDEMSKRTLARARKLDRGELIEPEFRITFERTEDMLACLTPVRMLLLAATKKKEMSISELAERLQRTRTAVQRDVKTLHRYGFIQMRKETNPGHGQVQMVRAAADRFTVEAYAKQYDFSQGKRGRVAPQPEPQGKTRITIRLVQSKGFVYGNRQPTGKD